MSALVWFRRDLRVEDNPAWAAATADHDAVTALFVVDPALWDTAGGHRRSMLGHHLRALDEALQDAGGRLCVRHGDPGEVVPTEAYRHDAVYWNADYTPYARRRDDDVSATVGDAARVHHGSAVHPPGSFETSGGGSYKVFTPYWRKWKDREWDPWPDPGDAGVSGDAGDGIPPIYEAALMTPGTSGAHERLDMFLDRVDAYPDERDRPDLDATSRLSADLKFGTISPRTVITTVGEDTEGRRAFVRQLAWRDFWMQILWNFPETVDRPMYRQYESIEWNDDEEAFEAWCTGRTGYPIVDAGMRQLIAEGWMHNRVRMITGSFLVKDLLIDWRKGERHFRRLLVDGDVAQNVGNWQWVAGTGADAAPYFRIFNPITQGEKFDPKGEYIRRYVPELSELGNANVHRPWEAGPLELQAAGVHLDESYPSPIVDHSEAREMTLARYESARAGYS